MDGTFSLALTGSSFLQRGDIQLLLQIERIQNHPTG
jgi:hypothetical protein